MIVRRILLFWVTIFVVATCTCCSGGDRRSYFLKRGEECKAQLIVELSEVQTLQDLFERQEQLTFLFDRIALLSIEASNYQMKTKTTWEVSAEAECTSLELKKQMMRVLKVPGARAFLEKCQASAFDKLYAFEMRNAPATFCK